MLLCFQHTCYASIHQLLRAYYATRTELEYLPLNECKKSSHFISLDISHIFKVAHYGSRNSKSILMCVFMFMCIHVVIELRFWM